jgi:hypothetical protein
MDIEFVNRTQLEKLKPYAGIAITAGIAIKQLNLVF